MDFWRWKTVRCVILTFSMSLGSLHKKHVLFWGLVSHCTMPGMSKILIHPEVHWMDGPARPNCLASIHPNIFLMLKTWPENTQFSRVELEVSEMQYPYPIKKMVSWNAEKLFCQELTVSLAWQAVKTGPNGNPADRDNFDMSSSSYRCLDAKKARKIFSGSWELENFRQPKMQEEQPWFTRKFEMFWLPPIFLRHLGLSTKEKNQAWLQV